MNSISEWIYNEYTSEISNSGKGDSTVYVIQTLLYLWVWNRLSIRYLPYYTNLTNVNDLVNAVSLVSLV